MPYFEIDIGTSSPCWAMKEKVMSRCVSLTTRTVVSYNSGTSASVGNPVSCA